MYKLCYICSKKFRHKNKLHDNRIEQLFCSDVKDVSKLCLDELISKIDEKIFS